MSLKDRFHTLKENVKWYLRYWAHSTPRDTWSDVKKAIKNPYTIIGLGFLITIYGSLQYRVIIGLLVVLFGFFYADYNTNKWREYKKEVYKKKAESNIKKERGEDT
jgi:hypothetical protein